MGANPQVRELVDMRADIGPMIAALLADENRWVHGQRIEVSGGMAL
jgi:hypothetical protein